MIERLLTDVLRLYMQKSSEGSEKRLWTEPGLRLKKEFDLYFLTNKFRLLNYNLIIQVFWTKKFWGRSGKVFWVRVTAAHTETLNLIKTKKWLIWPGKINPRQPIMSFEVHMRILIERNMMWILKYSTSIIR